MTSTAEMKANVARAPDRWLAFAEPGRAAMEMFTFLVTRPLLGSLPRGDGHSVLVIPGFLASDSTSAPMRKLLTDLGYDTHGWGLGNNIRIDNARMREMEELVLKLHRDSGRKVSIIGWSLGGLFARELAKISPDSVRQVITLGSPISKDRAHSNSTKLFEFFNGKEPEPIKDGRFAEPEIAPPVPTTSIYSRTDGIVHWHGSVQRPEAANKRTENVEVYSSHIGLGFNPSVMITLSNRLAQTEDGWSPFKPGFEHSWMFPWAAKTEDSEALQVSV